MFLFLRKNLLHLKTEVLRTSERKFVRELAAIKKGTSHEFCMESRERGIANRYFNIKMIEAQSRTRPWNEKEINNLGKAGRGIEGNRGTGLKLRTRKRVQKRILREIKIKLTSCSRPPTSPSEFRKLSNGQRNILLKETDDFTSNFWPELLLWIS